MPPHVVSYLIIFITFKSSDRHRDFSLHYTVSLYYYEPGPSQSLSYLHVRVASQPRTCLALCMHSGPINDESIDLTKLTFKTHALVLAYPVSVCLG